MNVALRDAVRTALDGQNVSRIAMKAAVGCMMDGQASPIEMAALLTALHAKGETADEIAGAAAAMKERVTSVPAKTRGLLDTCGTGGDRLGTFNISTATAFVVAACGVPVAKHGNRSATSTSGSAEVLEALGVDITLSPEQVARCIDEIGIGFCYARLLHSAMKHVAPVRKELGFPTIFNYLGPLTNPAQAEYQLIGTGRVAAAEKLARAVSELGTSRTLIVCGHNELDEVSLWGETTVFDVQDGVVLQEVWTPADFGLPACTVDTLTVDSPQESAAMIRQLMEGVSGPALDIVLANSAAALLCAGKCENVAEGTRIARQAVTTGRAGDRLKRLAEWTQSAKMST